MIPLPRITIGFSLLIVFYVMGCAQEHLPTYPRADESTSLHLLAQRTRRVQTVSGSGALELTQPNGQSVRLDLAVALRPPDWARLRAWKFGQAVFDLMLTPDGLWLEASRDTAHKDRATAAGVTAAQVAKTWSLLSGSFFDDPNLTAHDDGDRLIVRRIHPGEPTVICQVNRDTLTPRRYEMLDDKGAVRFSLTLDHYKDFSGIVWPMHLTAVSAAGKVAVELDDVELNGELPATAFKPPRRAEKLP
jgi:outer membrane lipoprotein-sorting protein